MEFIYTPLKKQKNFIGFTYIYFVLMFGLYTKSYIKHGKIQSNELLTYFNKLREITHNSYFPFIIYYFITNTYVDLDLYYNTYI